MSEITIVPLDDYPPIGSYGVTATGGVAGWFIRLGTFSRVNHAFIVGPEGKIVEANPTGAEFGHVSQYPNARYNLHTSLPQATREQIWASAVSMVGTPYNWLDVVALSLKFFHISLPWVNRRLARPDRLMCSQLVTEAYRRAHVYLFESKRSQEVDPGDLDELLTV